LSVGPWEAGQGGIAESGAAGDTAGAPLFYSVTVNEVTVRPPVRPNMSGISVERWYERYDDGTPVNEVTEGDLVRVRLRITVPADRQFVAIEDLLPAGLEVVDLSLRTSGSLGPFTRGDATRHAALAREPQQGPARQSYFYGSWDGGWWTPWEYKEIRDDKVLLFARQLWTGIYTHTYVARATTAGRFIRPPAQAVEMYNAAVQGRSEGGIFIVHRRR
jgi:alpha-2-macroglobulin